MLRALTSEAMGSRPGLTWLPIVQSLAEAWRTHQSMISRPVTCTARPAYTYRRAMLHTPQGPLTLPYLGAAWPSLERPTDELTTNKTGQVTCCFIVDKCSTYFSLTLLAIPSTCKVNVHKRFLCYPFRYPLSRSRST